MKGTEPMNNDEPMTIPEEALQSGRAVSETAAPVDAPSAPETFNTPQTSAETPDECAEKARSGIGIPAPGAGAPQTADAYPVPASEAAQVRSGQREAEAPQPEALRPEELLPEAPQQEDADAQLRSWQREAEDLQRVYPGFDLQRECAMPTGGRFAGLLQAGVDVRTAFEVIHRDEILGAAMRMTAERIRKQTLTGLQARSDRPTEGGTGHGGGFPEGPARFTRAEREEISRRVLRGERIRF